jgi:hypothetical protein
MQAFGAPTPVTWKARLPASWKITAGGSNADVASFSADHLAAREGAVEPEVVGKLVVAVFARGALKRPREAAAFYLDALADAGLRLASDAFVEEDAPEPFERAWLLVSAATRSASLPGEIRCRVLRHPAVWVLAGVVSSAAADDEAAWTHNQRALDVVTGTLRIKG